ncbi:MAG: helix-turn-helix transcriptional regulator [Candidatus Dojkabacteria bacterium]|nr:helix-turn-helix transcriptional regulator [Candidatus Dojkabacteria bacterium]MDQ7020478.1 helix-turn-helix transcriptional regulator [Candidatus Dojkabacteria bacterium]
MQTKNTTGHRLKSLRLLRQSSQVEIEMNARLSSSSLSRIEHNQINPSKETIFKIAEALDLTTREINYIVGGTANPPLEFEIIKAKSEVEEIFNKRGVFAYLLDDRWCFMQFHLIFKGS